MCLIYTTTISRLTQNNKHQNNTKHFEFSTVGKPNEVNRRPIQSKYLCVILVHVTCINRNMHQNDTKQFEFSVVQKPNELNRWSGFMLLPLCQLVASFRPKREVIKF